MQLASRFHDGTNFSCHGSVTVCHSSLSRVKSVYITREEERLARMHCTCVDIHYVVYICIDGDE